jgi:hypothetical protein
MHQGTFELCYFVHLQKNTLQRRAERKSVAKVAKRFVGTLLVPFGQRHAVSACVIIIHQSIREFALM